MSDPSDIPPGCEYVEAIIPRYTKYCESMNNQSMVWSTGFIKTTCSELIRYFMPRRTLHLIWWTFIELLLSYLHGFLNISLTR